jgi:hypothetical protein
MPVLSRGGNVKQSRRESMNLLFATPPLWNIEQAPALAWLYEPRVLTTDVNLRSLNFAFHRYRPRRCS